MQHIAGSVKFGMDGFQNRPSDVAGIKLPRIMTAVGELGDMNNGGGEGRWRQMAGKDKGLPTIGDGRQLMF